MEGNEPSVPVTPMAAVAATMQVDSHAGMKTVVKTDPGLTAPVAQGQRVGTMTVTAPDFPALTVPVYAAAAGDPGQYLLAHLEPLFRKALTRRMAGRFITLEGGEGSGKSTQVKRLAAALDAKGITAVTTREPGGSPGAEEIRTLLVNGEPGRWDALTETLLVYAARADHVARTIGPALLADKWVISRPFHAIPPLPIRARDGAWRAKPSGGSTAWCWTISSPISPWSWTSTWRPA